MLARKISASSGTSVGSSGRMASFGCGRAIIDVCSAVSASASTVTTPSKFDKTSLFQKRNTRNPVGGKPAIPILITQGTGVLSAIYFDDQTERRNKQNPR